MTFVDLGLEHPVISWYGCESREFVTSIGVGDEEEELCILDFFARPNFSIGEEIKLGEETEEIGKVEGGRGGNSEGVGGSGGKEGGRLRLPAKEGEDFSNQRFTLGAILN